MEESASETLQSARDLLLSTSHVAVETSQAHVLFAGAEKLEEGKGRETEEEVEDEQDTKDENEQVVKDEEEQDVRDEEEVE